MPEHNPILVAGERRFSHKQLEQQGNHAASALFAAGVEANDTVALILRNDFCYFVLHDAARYGPFEMVPVNWHLSPSEIDFILNDCRAKAVFIHADLLSHELISLLEGLVVVVVPTPEQIISAYRLDNSKLNTELPYPIWDEWLDSSKPCTKKPLAFYPPRFYTSGSSGRPKAVLRGKMTPEIVEKTGKRTSFAWGFEKTPIISVMTGPLYHSAPNGYANIVLQNHGTLILQARFDAEQLLQLIEHRRVTHLHMVPTMFNRLLGLEDSIKGKYDLSSLVHVTHGAAPCPPEVKRQMIMWWGPVIYEYYAMTETGIICCSSSEQWLSHPGSVGCAAPGASLEIRHDDGSLCNTNEIGMICVKHEATDSVAYQHATDNNTELIQNGFLLTGDIGYLDEDGYLFISDRKSDMIISGGVNIYPAEVEKELINMEGVRDCTVFGIPDPDFGEKLVAFIESDGQLNIKQITSFLKDRIAAFKVPRIFEQVLSLPREDSGKIKKRDIRQQYIKKHNNTAKSEQQK